MSEYYILDDNHNAVPVHSVTEWADYFEKHDHRVAYDEIDGIRVSTVFLGLDHAWDGGPPLIFETMIFGGPLDGEQDRYSTWDEAAKGHAAMLFRARSKG